MIRLDYWGFDGRPHQGTIVVNAVVVNSVIVFFVLSIDEHFPIMEMVPEDAYGGNDNLAAAADDTSGFNCRTPWPRVRPSGQCMPLVRPLMSMTSRTLM